MSKLMRQGTMRAHVWRKNVNCHPPVWALTTYRRHADKPLFGKLVRDERTVGLYATEAEAVEAVRLNYGDIEEAGWYQYAVIEPLWCGLYPISPARQRTWFEFVQFKHRPKERHKERGRWRRLRSRLAPAVLRKERGIGGKRGPRDITNWSEVG